MSAAIRVTLLLVAVVAVGELVVFDRQTPEAAGGRIEASDSDVPDSLKSGPNDARNRSTIAAALRDPFSPAPAPTPPPVPVDQPTPPQPPPPPSPPPLPFKYFGRVKGLDGSTADFVERENRLITATVGETLDDVYRVDRVDESEIVFLHIPTQQRQSLPVTPP